MSTADDERAPMRDPFETAAPQKALSAAESTAVEAVYEYDSCDLIDMSHPYSGVVVPHPPLGANVRINIGKDHELISSAELSAVRSLAEGARRVQITGQGHNVAFVISQLRQYLDEVARVEVRRAAKEQKEWNQFWGDAS